jgi:hypothetical protein
MNIKAILVHWPILTVAFSSGGAFAYQEVQRQTIEGVVKEQHEQGKEQKKVNAAIIKLQESRKFTDQSLLEIKNNMDMLIKIQLERK